MAPQEPLRRWPEQQALAARRRTRVREAIVVIMALIAVIAFVVGRRTGAANGAGQPAAVGQPSR